MTSDTDPPQLPAWDRDQAAAEQADHKPDDLCAWPGCERPRAPAPRTGRPPAYCQQADADTERIHDAETAKLARKAAEAADAPVSSAQATFSDAVARLDRQAATITDTYHGIVEALATLGDADAVLLEMHTLMAELERERRQRAAAEAHAADLEALTSQHRRALQHTSEQAADLERQAVAAQRRASSATNIAKQARRNRQRDQHRLQQLARERDGACEQATAAANERDAALERVRALTIQRDTVQARYDTVRRQLQALLADSDATADVDSA